MTELKIGKVAKRAQVGIDTIRYYEKIGLIPKPPRMESGYRLFNEDTVYRIQFIKRAKELGFTLREISELLSLRLGSKVNCNKVKKIAENKIADIDNKLEMLYKIKKALMKLSAACGRNVSRRECPILEILEAKR